MSNLFPAKSVPARSPRKSDTSANDFLNADLNLLGLNNDYVEMNNFDDVKEDSMKIVKI